MLEQSQEPRPVLTQRQREIYEFLKDKILNRGYGPTVREIGNHFGIRSPNGVMCHLKALEKKGLITRESHMSRAIQLAEAPEYRLTLRLAGRVSGSGPLKRAAADERVDFAPLFDTEGNCTVQVGGDELSSLGILDGDHLVVSRQPSPANGDLVVADLEAGQTVVQHYFRDGGSVRLELAGKTTRPSEVDVQGVVVGVIRRYS